MRQCGRPSVVSRYTELVGNGFDHRARQNFVQAQRPPQAAYKGELHGKPKAVVRASMASGQRQVLRRERTTSQGLLTLSWRVEQDGARLWRKKLGRKSRHQGFREASRKPTQNLWTGQLSWT